MPYEKKEINKLSKKIFLQNKESGWWDNPDRCIYMTLQLVNTEIAEATEGDRKNLMDDHLPDRKMAEVELADTFIRLLDLAGRHEWIYIDDCGVSPYLASKNNLAAKHYVLTKCVCDIGLYAKNDYVLPELNPVNKYYSRAVCTLLKIAEEEGYDLNGAVTEKLEYNKKRSDHKRENRSKIGGKKY